MVLIQYTSMTRCPSCRGTGRVPLYEVDEVLGKTVLTHPPCPTCEGTGRLTIETTNAAVEP